MDRHAIGKFIIATLVFSAEAWAGQPQKLKSSRFTVCGQALTLEVARTQNEKSTGLMYRNSVPPGTGMLFIFPKEQVLSFWMRNVPFSIDIGYFDSRGRLINAHTMAGTSPLQRDEALPTYSSLGAARFAVEVEAGFFGRVDKLSCTLRPLPKL
jgi:uncharacterized membrane protein (UPF0127 family)